jgi:serine phosphatase RsbU (regulator of sigma subunit)
VDGGRGPLLGVIDAPQFPAHLGRMERGDALLMYTDGLVENHGRDIGLGIDRLIGAAERVMARGFAGGADQIMDAARAGEGVGEIYNCPPRPVPLATSSPASTT